MSDEPYFRQRAEEEARLAATSPAGNVRAIHDTLRRAYLKRAEAIRREMPPVR